MSVGSLTIKLQTAKEDVTPERLEKIHRYSPGFAEAVRKMQKLAEGRWGWCTVDVIAEYKTSDGNIVTGINSLGSCSYYNAADFICNSSYFDGMVKEAVADLKKKLTAMKTLPMSVVAGDGG